MKKVVIVVAGQDRPGIVSSITQVLFELDCNVEDTNMLLLEDHFTMMMMVQPPSNTSVAHLQATLQKQIESTDLALSLFTVDVTQERVIRSGDPWMLSVTSPDQTGILYHVSQLLSQHGVSIYQLASRRLPQPDGTLLYLVTLEVDVSENADTDQFQRALQQLSKQYGFDVQSHPLETFML